MYLRLLSHCKLTRVHGITCSASARHRKVMGSLLGHGKPNNWYLMLYFIAHYHAQLGLLDKGRAIKGLVVCYVVWLGSMIYWMGLWTSVSCVWYGPLLWSGWLSSSSTATPHSNMKIQYNTLWGFAYIKFYHFLKYSHPSPQLGVPKFLLKFWSVGICANSFMKLKLPNFRWRGKLYLQLKL